MNSAKLLRPPSPISAVTEEQMSAEDLPKDNPMELNGVQYNSKMKEQQLQSSGIDFGVARKCT